MKSLTRVLACAALCIPFGTTLAQEHYSEGPVWDMSFYRINEGKFDEYMEYVRTNSRAVYEEAKKQGLILDYRMFVKNPTSPEDWDFAVGVLYPNAAKAIDFSQADDDKWNAISARIWDEQDVRKRNEMSAVRYDMRKFLGNMPIREITLKPMD